MMDAIAILAPEVLDQTEFVSGDEYYAKALEWRDRPPMQVLAKYREEGREYWLEFIGPELNTGGSMYVHDRIACTNETARDAP
jgi:hypothetical protein